MRCSLAVQNVWSSLYGRLLRCPWHQKIRRPRSVKLTAKNREVFCVLAAPFTSSYNGERFSYQAETLGWQSRGQTCSTSLNSTSVIWYQKRPRPPSVWAGWSRFTTFPVNAALLSDSRMARRPSFLHLSFSRKPEHLHQNLNDRGRLNAVNPTGVPSSLPVCLHAPKTHRP